ncbi:MAG: hypothetical protein M1587_05305 [Thaumarchaeota archaeon]|nr:hypothetical protein [Nitrososphaerota archaeon]
MRSALRLVLLVLLVASLFAEPLAATAYTPSSSPSIPNQIYVSVGRGQSRSIPIYIDNSNSLQNWTVLQFDSSSTGSRSVNVTIDWTSSILKEVPAGTNNTYVLVHVNVAKDAPISTYASHIILVTRTAIIPPYQSAQISFEVTVQVVPQMQRSFLFQWLTFSIVFIGISVIAIALTVMIYINRNIISLFSFDEVYPSYRRIEKSDRKPNPVITSTIKALGKIRLATKKTYE